jgi:SAM-dependent methyltransferase
MGGIVGITGVFRRGLELAARLGPIRRIAVSYYDRKWTHGHPIHPIDGQYGIRTSGVLPGSVLRLGYSIRMDTTHIFYAGSQPSIIRHALRVIPDYQDAVFVDLGCGKGRTLVVASEFPFREIIGVEISPEVAGLAHTNAQTMARNFPHRTRITIVNADAANFQLPEGDLVIFLYNPFGEELMTKLLSNIEHALANESRKIYIIYYNPVWGRIFDESSLLRRVHAKSVPYDSVEIGSGPDSSDVVVIWQDVESAPASSPKGADRKIVVTRSGLRAELAG